MKTVHHLNPCDRRKIMSMEPVSPLLTIEGLAAWYERDRPVLKDICLEIHSGEVVGLLGVNGAGKTTLLQSICSVHRMMDCQRFLLNGKPSSPRSETFKRQRYLSLTEDTSFPTWSLSNFIRFIERVYRIPHDATRLDSLIRGFHFEGYRATAFSELSSGSRKKANLITAFYVPVPLLLLDEPVDFLDFMATEFLYDSIVAARAEGQSILLSSHIAESFTRCSSRIHVLKDGVLNGPFPTPGDPHDVASLIG